MIIHNSRLRDRDGLHRITLAVLKAILKVREETRHLIDLQIFAFPQEGIEA